MFKRRRHSEPSARAVSTQLTQAATGSRTPKRHGDEDFDTKCVTRLGTPEPRGVAPASYTYNFAIAATERTEPPANDRLAVHCAKSAIAGVFIQGPWVAAAATRRLQENGSRTRPATCCAGRRVPRFRSPSTQARPTNTSVPPVA